MLSNVLNVSPIFNWRVSYANYQLAAQHVNKIYTRQLL